MRLKALEEWMAGGAGNPRSQPEAEGPKKSVAGR